LAAKTTTVRAKNFKCLDRELKAKGERTYEKVVSKKGQERVGIAERDPG